jgi:hypothetical protein
MAKNITIDELAAMTQRGLADVEQRIGERMDIGFSALTTLMQDMLAEVTATHADVRVVQSTAALLVQSDTAHEAAIKDLTARMLWLERKAGLA